MNLSNSALVRAAIAEFRNQQQKHIMNTQHTPGPWRLGFDPSRVHDDETTIWAGTEAVGNAITKEPQLHIPHIKQAHANARLIAAAPELLEALQWLTEEIGNPADPKRPSVDAIQSARAAIAKARTKTMKPEITHCVDGHEFENEESNLAGDGQFPPFRIFDIAAQDYLSGTFPDRESAERAMRAIPNAVFE